MNLVRELFVFFFVISQCSAAKVAIIGGGLAGMAALSELSDAHDVKLFETDGTVGGRISSSAISGMYVNTGAATVPKYVDSALYGILKDRRNVKVLDYDSVIYYEGNNVVINDIEAKSGVDMTDVLKKINLESLESKSATQSLYIAAYNAGLKNKNMYQKFQSWDHFDYEFNVPPQETPLNYANPILQYGEDLYPVLTNDLLGVVNTIESKHVTKIETNANVNEIQYDDNGVKVKYTKTPSEFTYDADYLLVTVSIGVLQKERITFTPALPTVKIEAIKNDYEMGKYLNIYAEFSGIFWNTSFEHFAYIQSEPGKLGSAIININSVSLRSEKSSSNPYILQFVVVGDEADRVAELTSTELKNEISALVKKMWASATVPNNIYTKLFNTTNFYGSIATPTLSFNPTSRVKVCSPLKNRVFFAGEVCSDKYSISAVAAYQSGLIAAGNINMASKGAVFPEYQMEDSTKFKGCTTKSAMNYNPAAEVDDGSCMYSKDGSSEQSGDEKESSTNAFAKMIMSFVGVFMLFTIIFYIFYFTSRHFRKYEY